jgi:1-acyl-sn-glycerol-3-phosphate acyltransferase
MLFMRNVIFNTLFLVTSVALSLLAAPGLIMPYRAVIWYKQLWLTIVLGPTRNVMGIDFELRSRENIPDGPVIFAAKHQSALDTFVLSLMHPQCVFVLKRELVRLPIWGWYLLRMGNIPIDRSKGLASLKKITDAAARTVENGQSIIIFPQGTRTLPGTARAYLPGVAALYKGANVPVVPVALNSGLFWPKKMMRKHPGTFTLEYLTPIEPGLDRRTFMQTLQAVIEPETARLESEALRRFPDLPPIVRETVRPGDDAGAVET